MVASDVSSVGFSVIEIPRPTNSELKSQPDEGTSSSVCCRLGQLDFIHSNNKSQKISTPCLAVPCTRGVPKYHTFPQLREIFSKSSENNTLNTVKLSHSFIITIPLCDIYMREKQLSAFSLHLEMAGIQSSSIGRQYFGIDQDIPLLLTFRDPSQEGPSIFGCESSISVQMGSLCGRFEYNPSTHLRAIQWLQPNLVVLPAEELPTGEGIGAKRQRRSVEKAKGLYALLRDSLAQEKSLNCKSGLLWNLQGGSNLISRKFASDHAREFLETSKEISCQYPPIGVCVGGLGYSEGSIEINSYLKSSLEKVPTNALRFTSMIGRPVEILQAVWYGIDIVEATFPILCAERGIAFAFSPEPPSDILDQTSPQNNSEFQLEEMISIIFTSSQLHHCRIYELTDAQLYSQDFSKFSKAQISDVSFSYVHHLFNCNEMLGPLLVYRHNLKTYAEFFEQIRRFSHSKHLLASYIIWFVNTQSQDKVPQGI